jgi:hypothetical protein
VGARVRLDRCGKSRLQGNASVNITDMFSGLPQLIYENTKVIYLLVKNRYFLYFFQANFFSVIPHFDASDSVLRK